MSHVDEHSAKSSDVISRLEELERKVVRLQELEDLQAIRDQYARYARSADWQDEKLRLEMIWPDAQWEHGKWTGVGGQDWMDQVWPHVRELMSNQLHYITNHAVMLTSSTKALAESYFIHLGEMKAPVEKDGRTFRTWLVTAGKYEDHFEKRGDLWKVCKHQMIVDLKTSFNVEEIENEEDVAPVTSHLFDINSPVYWYFKTKESS